MESGDHWGAIGKPIDVVDSVASLALTSMGHGHGPILQTPLRALVLLYRCGNNVKCRWSNLCGLVTLVNEVEVTLTFVKQYSNINVSVNTWARCSFDAFIRSPFPSMRWSHTTPCLISFASQQGPGSNSPRKGEGTKASDAAMSNLLRGRTLLCSMSTVLQRYVKARIVKG